MNLNETFQKFCDVLFESPPSQLGQTNVQDLEDESREHGIIAFLKWYTPLEKRMEKCILKAYSPDDSEASDVVEEIKRYYKEGKYLTNEQERFYLNFLKSLYEAYVNYLEDDSNIDEDLTKYAKLDVRNAYEGTLSSFIGSRAKNFILELLLENKYSEGYFDFEFYSNWDEGSSFFAYAESSGQGVKVYYPSLRVEAY